MEKIALAMMVVAVLAFVMGARAIGDLLKQGSYAYAIGGGIILLTVFAVAVKKLKKYL